jgi:hypothetical protein
MNRHSFALSLSLIFLALLDGHSQQPSDATTVFKVITEKATLFKSKPELLSHVSPDVLALVNLLEKDSLALWKLAPKEFPDDFLESLQSDADQLSQIDVKNPTPKDARRLRMVVADLHLKVHNARVNKEKPFSITWAEGAPTKAPVQSEVFKTLAANLEKLSGALINFSDIDKEASNLISTVKSDFAVLERFNADNKGSEAYLLGLACDAYLFLLASKKETLPVVASAYFHFGAYDIHVKAVSAQAKKSPFDDVKAKVETVSRVAKKPAAGFEVWYSPAGLANNPTLHKRFREFSTPTIQSMPAGTYRMWTRERSTKGSSDEIDVVDGGDGECRINLWTP